MSEIGYTPKNLLFNEDGRERLFSGIEKLANAVKSTLGPSGQTVLIESPQHTHGITVTKDGVTVAKSVSLLDATENLAVRIMREASERTATQAGDGTTTAIVLAEALVKEAYKHLNDGKHNKTMVLRDIVRETEKIVSELKKKSRKVNKSTLKDVATISANNDKEIGSIIAEVYKKLGKHGVVAVDKSQTSETYYEATSGIKVDRGYASPLFVNDQKKDECVLEDVFILVSDATIENILQIETVLKPIIQENKRLLIIAPTSSNVTNTLAANVMKSNLQLCAIQPPNFGYKQHELMQDIAISVGATYFSEKTGDDLSHMTFADLGHASRVVVGTDSTVVIKDDNTLEDEIKSRAEELKIAADNSTKKADKEFIMSRIASLMGGVGVIYVGGNTDLEQKELYDRVDDAVCAVRSALEEGILPGGGVALYKMAEGIDTSTVSGKILSKALMAPMLQIYENAGLTVGGSRISDEFNHGQDVKTQEYGDMYEMGVIDPVKVTKCALQNAVSVAVTLLSTNAIITMARTYEDK